MPRFLELNLILKNSLLPFCHFETTNTWVQVSLACLPGLHGRHCMCQVAAGWFYSPPEWALQEHFADRIRLGHFPTPGMSLLCFLLSVFVNGETLDTFCMVTLLEDATSLYNKYLLSVFYNLAHFLYPLCWFPRAVLYLPYRVLVCVFTLFPSDLSFPIFSFFF